jgi:hypothetical protein
MRLHAVVPTLCAIPFLAASVSANAQPPAVAHEPPHREPLLALALSAAGTGVGLGLLHVGYRDHNDLTIGAGWLAFELGPTAGSWYAGRWWSAGLIVRGAGTAMYALGENATHCDYEADSDCDVPGKMLGALGILVAGFGVAADLVEAPVAAQAFNRREESLRLYPTALVAPGGLVPGFAVSGTF